jgi:hypothetical protein
MIIAALLGCVVTGAGAWLTWASDVVTEAKAIDLIEIHSPYVEDRKILINHLNEAAELRKELSELVALTRELNVKLDIYTVDHEIDDHHGGEVQ